MLEESNPVLSLRTISEASRMLQEMRSLEDVRQIRDLAEAARAYARSHRLGLDAQNHAGAIVVEADIRQGEILKELALSEGGRPSKTGTKTEPVLPTLAGLNTPMAERGERAKPGGDYTSELSTQTVPSLAGLNTSNAQTATETRERSTKSVLRSSPT
jgi:hypothetical protein